jgi:hypothetical protein
MKIAQSFLTSALQWQPIAGELEPTEAQLVLAFGSRDGLSRTETNVSLRQRFPLARILTASTAGHLLDQTIDDPDVACTAIAFESSSFDVVLANVGDFPSMGELCGFLAKALVRPGLRHVWVVSDGSMVNGTELCQGLDACLPTDVQVSGGLAGDGTLFSRTVVGLDNPPAPGNIVAIGLYGKHLHVSWGSAGGWSSFGPERQVTRSDGNCLYELDGKQALQLYKDYLGEFASGLPASALRFPLSVIQPGQQTPVVRTILSIDEDAGSMTFAGDIPEGSAVRLMRASYEDLIDGARDAARQASMDQVELVLCVSCVGRRILLGQRIEEEPECLRDTFGPTPFIAGFYSYGELVPSGSAGNCQLHNQTLTLTCLRES